jgi:hypothetical protein
MFSWVESANTGALAMGLILFKMLFTDKSPALGLIVPNKER